jgi:ferredoxin-like protein FixX
MNACTAHHGFNPAAFGAAILRLAAYQSALQSALAELRETPIAPTPTVKAATPARIYGDDDPRVTHAICVQCGQSKPVCCDSGYRMQVGGTVEHDNARCVACCTHHHGPAPRPDPDVDDVDGDR